MSATDKIHKTIITSTYILVHIYMIVRLYMYVHSTIIAYQVQCNLYIAMCLIGNYILWLISQQFQYQ